MVDIFEKEMCNYCKNTNCQKKVVINVERNLVTYICPEYEKDDNKIIKYEKPLVVTAKRDYVREITT